MGHSGLISTINLLTYFLNTEEMELLNSESSTIKAATEGLRVVINSHSKHKILKIAEVIDVLYQSTIWPEIYNAIISKNLLSMGQVSLLLGISRNKYLMANGLREYLPNSYNILYQLSFLNKKQLNQFVEIGAICPEMNLAAAKKLRLKP